MATSENALAPMQGPGPSIECGCGLLLSDDLLFGSRITGTAEALGLTVHTARSAGELLRHVEQLQPACVLLDLHNPGLEIAAVVAALRAKTRPPRLVAYGSHVEAATLRCAREAGCDHVLPRSKFVEELPHALSGWLTADAARA